MPTLSDPSPPVPPVPDEEVPLLDSSGDDTDDDDDSLASLLASSDDEAPRSSRRAPHSAQETYDPASEEALVPDPRSGAASSVVAVSSTSGAAPAAQMRSVLNQIRESGADDDDDAAFDIRTVQPSAAAPAGVPAPVAGSQLTHGAPAMLQTGTAVHNLFKQHWADMSEATKPHRMAIPALLSRAQRRRWLRLVNVDNWDAPGGDEESAPNDPAHAHIPSAHPDDVLLPEALIPPHLLADEGDGGAAPAATTGQPTLRAHQVEGVRFLWARLVQAPLDKVRTAGCILAHSMGLGKTMQVLAFVALYFRHVNPEARVLLLVPKSTLVSWSTEIKKWLPYYTPQGSQLLGGRRILVFDDLLSRGDRVAALRAWTRAPEDHPCGGLFVMGYETATHMCIGGTRGGTSTEPAVQAAHLRVDALLCDEGHRLKSAKRNDTVFVQSVQAKRRMILTGTPLQNHLLEYFTMINCVMPDFFELKKFRVFFMRPIAKSMSKHADAKSIEIARQRTFTLIKEVEPFVLRRDTSVLTKELPQLAEFVVVVPLTPIQGDLYDKLLSILRKQQKRVNLLQAFSYSTKLCAHPQVLFDAYERLIAIDVASSRQRRSAVDDPILSIDDNSQPAPAAGTSEAKAAKKSAAQQLAAEIHQEFKALCKPPVGYESRSDDSAKLQVAVDIIRACMPRGERCLVFSMSTKLLDFFESMLQRAASEFNEPLLSQFLRIDGASSSSVRRVHIERFQQQQADDEQQADTGDGSGVPSDDEAAASTQELRVDAAQQEAYPIFLLSTKAGGVGLTLTAATRIIILDCSWNPADDRQAIARAFRYGQTKPVFVYRLVCHNTMEHRIFDQKIAKEWLFQTVVDSEVVKRDKLRGVRLQDVLFRPRTAAPLTAEERAEFDRCCRADRVLSNLRDAVRSAASHNTMLEEDEAEYGESERTYYEQYRKRGGFLANELVSTQQADAVATAVAQQEADVQVQARSLASVLQSILARRQTSTTAGVDSFLSSIGAKRDTETRGSALERTVYVQRRRVEGVGSTKDVALDVDDSDNDKPAPPAAPSAALRAIHSTSTEWRPVAVAERFKARQAEQQAAAAAAAGAGKEDDPFVIDDDD